MLIVKLLAVTLLFILECDAVTGFFIFIEPVAVEPAAVRAAGVNMVPSDLKPPLFMSAI